jgi:Double zinc ribbon
MASDSTASVACPSCGRPASGKFCVQCGVSLDARQCATCGSPLPAGIRFCAQCGAPTGSGRKGGAGGSRERATWFGLGAGAVLLPTAIVALLLRGQPVAPPASDPAAAAAPFAAGATGPAPDISSMSPRERFDRLYNRIMQAAQSGDQQTVTNFSPMALAAYGMLDTVDADARYHAALIRMHSGDVAGAVALGDSILLSHPGHLFGYMILGTAARFQKNQRELDKSYAGFLAHYDAEIKAQRPEYEDHRPALEEFQRAAQAAKGKTP